MRQVPTLLATTAREALYASIAASDLATSTAAEEGVVILHASAGQGNKTVWVFMDTADAARANRRPYAKDVGKLTSVSGPIGASVGLQGSKYLVSRFAQLDRRARTKRCGQSPRWPRVEVLSVGLEPPLRRLKRYGAAATERVCDGEVRPIVRDCGIKQRSHDTVGSSCPPPVGRHHRRVDLSIAQLFRGKSANSAPVDPRQEGRRLSNALRLRHAVYSHRSAPKRSLIGSCPSVHPCLPASDGLLNSAIRECREQRRRPGTPSIAGSRPRRSDWPFRWRVSWLPCLQRGSS